MVIVLEIEGPAGLVLDVLARLQLAARDWDGSIRVRDPDPVLVELLDVCGLARTLRSDRAWQAERREQVGVEEGVNADDLPC